jgi:hypothetical protein
MEDKKIDSYRREINPELWKKLKISALTQNKLISQWLSEAIKLKLENDDNEK